MPGKKRSYSDTLSEAFSTEAPQPYRRANRGLTHRGSLSYFNLILGTSDRRHRRTEDFKGTRVSKLPLLFGRSCHCSKPCLIRLELSVELRRYHSSDLPLRYPKVKMYYFAPSSRICARAVCILVQVFHQVRLERSNWRHGSPIKTSLLWLLVRQSLFNSGLTRCLQALGIRSEILAHAFVYPGCLAET